MDKNFSVVFFPTDNSVEVVPSVWLSDDRERCPFPIGRSKGLQKLQENINSIPDNNWPVWEVSVLKTFDSFSKANKKAQSLLTKRNLEVSESEDQTHSRSRRSGDAQLDSRPGTAVAPPQNLFLDQDTGSPLEPPPTINTGAESQLPANNDEQHNDNGGNAIQIFQVEDPRLGSFIDEFRAFQKATIENQVAILEELKELKRMVLRVSGNSHVNSIDPPSTLWPLKTEEDLSSSEILLSIPANFTKEIALLSRIGGNTVAKTVNNILKFILSHELALKLRITSQTGKTAFGGTVTAKLVRESVRKFYEVEEPGDPTLKFQITDDKLDSLIGKWLRDSVGRGKDGKNRRQTNRNSTINEATPNSENSAGSLAEDPTSAN